MTRPAKPLTTEPGESSPAAISQQALGIACALIFHFAVGVRLLVWFNNASEIDLPMSGLTRGYANDARTLLSGDIGLFVRGPNPPSDANVLAHPPGYPILMAAVFGAHGSLNAVRVVQLLVSSGSAVLVFLIALQFLPWRAAWLAGGLVALSPQLAYNSLLLLPDSLSIFPILLALWLLLRRGRAGDWVNLIGCGALFGLSLWLRANMLLLPVFIAVALAAFILPPGRRWRSLAIVAGAILLIAPLTIRNAIVFGRFIPISLAGGVTLMEGIADYDHEGRFSLPRTDMRVIDMEAREQNRPDYRNSLFNPDGVERERERTRRSVRLIGAHPFWFATVIARRDLMMLRLERVPAIAPAKQGAETGPLLLRWAGGLLRLVQRAFITAVFWPLALAGLILVWRRRELRAPAMLLLTVVIYLLAVQSWLHTEYRYVQIIQYVSLLFAAFALATAFAWLKRWMAGTVQTS
ncbi:MAG: glycosyltransferase family 39 protein [Pyrinomonadaceae bacterium]